MELTFRLTRDDYRQFVQLAQARVAGHAKRVSGWRGNPTVFFLTSALLPVLVVAFPYSDRLVGDAGAIVAAFAYFWGVLSMTACGQYWQRQYLQHFFPDDSPALGETHLSLTGDGIETTKAGRASRYRCRPSASAFRAAIFPSCGLTGKRQSSFPSRAFASDAAHQAYLDEVLGHLPTMPATGGERS